MRHKISFNYPELFVISRLSLASARIPPSNFHKICAALVGQREQCRFAPTPRQAHEIVPWSGSRANGCLAGDFCYTKSNDGGSNHDQAGAMSRAAQIAIREIKSKIRDEGRRTSDYAISNLRRVAAALLKDRPEIVERAATEVAAWRGAKFKTSAQKRSR
jgi:hypothetical protein